MALYLPSSFSVGHKQNSCYSSISAFLEPRSNTFTKHFEESKERIKSLFNNVELSASSYDTAWVALVPSPHSSGGPYFPQCINWLLDNQLGDGSWGLPHREPSLVKDALSSTVASLLALKRWGIGEEHINKGLRFLELNITSASDENLCSPIGFDIIFPRMVQYANELELNLPIAPRVFDAMLQKRALELRRGHLEGRKSYFAYISEGLGNLQDWEMVMKYQRKNGSLFNSPSTTAAACMYLQDENCLNYLRSLLKKFGSSVPTVHPHDIFIQLRMVDTIESLGIERHFEQEVKNVLDETYRCWLQGDEEIFLDNATCAMAFRILRLHGFNVSADPLRQMNLGKEASLFPAVDSEDVDAAFELYRASQIMICPDEGLEKEYLRSRIFLKEKLSEGPFKGKTLDKHHSEEVVDTLRFPFHANLERIENRRSIERYSTDSTTILKTSIRSSSIRNEDFLNLAVEDFNMCQSIHREEFKQVERWVVENRIDKLKFGRQKQAYCYITAAATFYSPELTDARMSWAKHGVLTTVIDDFFDFSGSVEELENLIQLVKKWDVNVAVDGCSEHVRILFSALHSTICETAAKAFTVQGRCVRKHIIDIWLDVLNSMWTEARWVEDKSVPTMKEYLSNGLVSVALGPIVLPALYLIGPILPKEMVSSSEYSNLFKLMSTCGRLLNDVVSFERESKQGKLNAVTLHMIHNSECFSAEEAVAEVNNYIDINRRQLLRSVLETEGSLVPRACKDLFWKMTKAVHLFYMKGDGYSSHELMNSMKTIIDQPIVC